MPKYRQGWAETEIPRYNYIYGKFIFVANNLYLSCILVNYLNVTYLYIIYIINRYKIFFFNIKILYVLDFERNDECIGLIMMFFLCLSSPFGTEKMLCFPSIAYYILSGKRQEKRTKI